MRLLQYILLEDMYQAKILKLICSVRVFAIKISKKTVFSKRITESFPSFTIFFLSDTCSSNCLLQPPSPLGPNFKRDFGSHLSLNKSSLVQGK